MRLGLRAQLALGFAVLLAVFLLFGGASLSWLARLGGSIDVILRENYRSVVAAQEMKEAMERMDSGALFALTGDPEQGRTLADLNDDRFARALAVELSNITLPGERERAGRLGEEYRVFRATLERVLAADEPLEDRRRLYYDSLLPRFQEIKRLADEIQRINQENMVAASVSARESAARGRQQMVVALLAAVAVAVGCVLFLSRAILVPLRRLTNSAREIEAGNLDSIVEAPPGDELGRLADAFNAMARRLREVRRSDRYRLLRAQQTSQLAIDSLPAAVVLLSPSREVELANRAAVALLRARPGQPLDERHAGWFSPLVDEAERGGPPPAADAGYAGAVQLFVEGRERFFLPHAVALRDGDGRLIGTTLILSDVTELRRLDEMKTDLVSTVSHELLTPLTSLAMAIHILLDDGAAPLTAEQTDLLVAARDDAERLRRILAGLLDVARLEAGREPLRLEAVTAGDLVEDAVSPLRAAYADRGVSLEVEVAPAAPAVAVDRTRAGLVLTNLLTNALKHTPAGGSVRVEAAAEGSRVRFAVADSGPGVPAEYRERVFDKFFQVPGRPAAGGAGLGLAIAREIVAAHGGEIRCASGAEGAPPGGSSPEGSGATFHFTLPVARPEIARGNRR
jgi:signal transduction histidine kinase/HAMP domain-containing protein